MAFGGLDPLAGLLFGGLRRLNVWLGWLNVWFGKDWFGLAGLNWLNDWVVLVGLNWLNDWFDLVGLNWFMVWAAWYMAARLTRGLEPVVGGGGRGRL